LKISNGLRRILSNTSWIVMERAIRLGVGFFVGVWVARYLGPAQFGVLSFGIAWVALFATFGKLGLEGIVVRDIVAHRESENEILGTATLLHLVGALVVVVVSVGLYGLFYGWTNTTQLTIIALIAIAQIFLTAEVIDWWFRSRVEWKFAFRARIAAFALSTGVKVVLLLTNFGVEWFAAVVLVDAAFMSLFLYFEWRRHGERSLRWTATGERAKRLLSDSWPAILSGLAIMVYMRIDQIMIGSMLTDADVGIYSVAVRLSEVWYVIPMAVTQSVMPSVVAARQAQNGSYEQRLTWLIALLFWGSLLVAIIVSMIAPVLITALFGPEYRQAGEVLRIHFWAGVFVALGLGISQWFLAENLLKVNLYRTLAGAGANIFLNLWLIPLLGILGAAVATIVSYFVSAYLSTSFFPSGRPAWHIINNGIFYPIRRILKF
jgi:polysaccharide transporter, PST family